MSTIRETVKETIESYNDEYLTRLINDGEFIAIETDGEISEIAYERLTPEEEATAEDMREAILEFFNGFENGFFDDEEGESLMADIVKNDMLYEWGADPVLLESYDQKISLLEYVKDYGYTEITKEDCNRYDWDAVTRSLDLNRRFGGTIYQTNKWNSENMTFCLDWDVDDGLQYGAIDLPETEDLLEEIEDGKVAYWNGERTVTLNSGDDKVAVKEWIEKHDVTELILCSTNDEYWAILTGKLGLPASYDGSIYVTGNAEEFVLAIIDDEV